MRSNVISTIIQRIRQIQDLFHHCLPLVLDVRTLLAGSRTFPLGNCSVVWVNEKEPVQKAIG